MVIMIHLVLLAALCWLIAGLMLNEKLLPEKRAKNPAQVLNDWLQSWQLLSSTGGALSTLEEVPQFKFFSRLASAGLRHARTYGSFPRELLWEWREGVNKEREFDQRWNGIFHSAYAQFILFVGITWLFVFFTRDSLEMRMPFAVYAIMLVLQAAGLVLFIPTLRLLSQYQLKGFSELLESLYVLRSLSGAGLATGQVLSEARLEALVKTARLNPLIERVEELAKVYQKQGGVLGREAQILLQETWFLREEAMKKLMKTGEALKLAFLLVFFAGAYFSFLTGMVFVMLNSN